jgi:hypothetical protein
LSQRQNISEFFSESFWLASFGPEVRNPTPRQWVDALSYYLHNYHCFFKSHQRQLMDISIPVSFGLNERSTNQRWWDSEVWVGDAVG